MKAVIVALIVWASGDSTYYQMASKLDCVELTRDLAPLVESADCVTFWDMPETVDYFPPAD